jgi:quercetin dioxygenase-like cupin family protein
VVDVNGRSTGNREDVLLELAAIDALAALEAEPRELSPEERVKLDPAYVEARDAYEQASALLGLAAAPAAPPPSLKQRLLARIAEEPAQDGAPEGSFFVKAGVTGVRTKDASWQKTPLPGVEAKTIHRDDERGYTTRLVRIEPGGRYPYHKHGGTEEIFMLEGTVWVNGKLLVPGDYCRSEAGTDERGTVSDHGALAVVISSDKDEISLADVEAPEPPRD